MKIGLDSGVPIASVKRVGEKHHAAATALSHAIEDGNHSGVCSALALIEIPGALAGSTSMPLEKIFEVELSLIDRFRITALPFEPYADLTVNLMLEFRNLKRKFGIGSADFHHLATASSEGCDIFVTTDERHLLKRECREELAKYAVICTPGEALSRLRSSA